MSLGQCSWLMRHWHPRNMKITNQVFTQFEACIRTARVGEQSLGLVPLVSNEGTAGLGAGRAPFAPVAKNSLGPATMRLATRTKMLKPPAKAFQSPIDDEDSDFQFLKFQNLLSQEVTNVWQFCLVSSCLW
ncbi:hypothetical protein SFRURICE_010809 [Spodoptera frugiperda]|nr:hypothetical protein SFRURICE_010809 [Spodoptera frugiperda]